MDYKVQTINSAETACFIFKTKTLCKCPSWSNLTSNLQSSPPATPAAATSTPPRSRRTSPRRAAAAVSTPPPPRRGRPQTPHPSSSSSTWDSQVRLLQPNCAHQLRIELWLRNYMYPELSLNQGSLELLSYSILKHASRGLF